MFKKLRAKFVAITMVMVALVMAFAFTAACVTEYQRSATVVQTALSDAIDNALALKERGQHRPSDEGQAPPQRHDSESSGGAGASTAAEASGQPFLPDALRIPLAYAEQGEAGQAPGTGGQPALSGQAASQDGNERQGQTGQPSSGDGSENARQAMQDAPQGNRQSGESQQADPSQGQQPGAENPQLAQAAGNDGSPAPAQMQAQEAGGEAGEEAGADGDEGQAEPAADQNSGADEQQGASGEQQAQGEADAGSASRQGADSPNSTPDTGDSLTLDDDSEGPTAPPVIGNRDGVQRASSSLIPVAVYSVSEDGTMRLVPQVTSASMSQDVLLQAAQRALERDDDSGTFDDLQLHYLKRAVDGTTYIAFADTSYTDGWKSLALTLLVAGLVTLAIFFIVCLFYSRWALRPVREAWDSQRQFVADASHDLKTPLTVILANASILLKHPERSIASESQWIESTQKEAEDMQGLVNEMLELASIEAGTRVEGVREPIDFSDLVDGETLLFDSVALERSCGFECSIEGGVSVVGDGKQVKKMVSTLVENAFKYVEDGGKVDIRLSRSGKNAVLAIRNSGSVIAAEDLLHIFDRFYRTDKARTSGAGGFGLGLAIAREVAVQHGGDITCSSSEGEGTTFTVTLPTA